MTPRRDGVVPSTGIGSAIDDTTGRGASFGRGGRRDRPRPLRTLGSLTAAVAVLLIAPSAQAAIPGAVDSRFGSCGQGTGLVPRDIAARQFSYGAGASLAAQPDGKIVAAGPAARGMGATRFNPDGTLDRSFGGDGVAFIPAPGGRETQTQVASVAIQGDGKVVAAGWLRTQASASDPSSPVVERILIARFTPSGEPDASFSGDGLVLETPPGAATASAHAIAPAGGGAVIVAGQVDQRFALARYRDDGTLDPAFGEGGVARVATASTRPQGHANAVAVLPDGRIAAAGSTREADGTPSAFTVARLTPSGAPDTSFAGTGIVFETFDASSAASALALLPDGRLYAVGTTADFWGDDEGGGTTRRAAIVRYLESGARDTTFAGDGSVLDALGEGLYADVSPTAAALGPDGTLTIATGRGPLARYTPEGARDSAFGAGGVLRIFSAPSGESLVALPDGSLFLGGGNGRQDTRPSGFEFGPAVLKLAGSGTALAAIENQPAACFLRLRNPTITHMLRRRGTAPNGKPARNGTMLIAYFLTEPATTFVGGELEESGGGRTPIGEERLPARAAGSTSVEIRVRKAAARRLATLSSARVLFALTTQVTTTQPVSGEKTLRR